MPFYSDAVDHILFSRSRMGESADENASGTAASFRCGAFARISLRIEDRRISDIRYTTNGCGWMLTACEVLAGKYAGRELDQLHGLTGLDREFEQLSAGRPPERDQCVDIARGALKAALAEHRQNVVEEFRGERELICTCFGISEETIEKCIVENEVRTVPQLSALCRAGSGCGSCTMLLQELIDVHC